MKYSEKLKDPRWQKKRLEILERDGFTCQFCYETDKTLHIHHIAYHNCDPWDISSRCLITLCGECHATEQEEVKLAGRDLITIVKDAGFTANDIGNICTGFIRLAEEYGDLRPHIPDATLIGKLIAHYHELESVAWAFQRSDLYREKGGDNADD